MLSLGLWAGFVILSILFAAAVLAWVARALGSARGRFGAGLAASAALAVLSVGGNLIALSVPADAGNPTAVAVVLVAVHLLIAFLVLQKVFRLPIGRTFGLFGAYLGMAAGLVAAALLLVRPFVFEGFSIPSASMAPTLEEGDHILVNKLLRPRRWDLTAYWTDDPKPMVFSKRLVGLPGERLRFENGQLYVNDEPQPAPPVVAGRYHAAFPARALPWRATATAKRSSSARTKFSPSGTTSTSPATPASSAPATARKSSA